MKQINTIQKNKKISSLNMQSSREIEILLEKREEFIPAEAEIDGENIKFTYDISDLKSFENLKSENEEEKLNILLNTGSLFEKINEFSFSLNPANLYYSITREVKILERNIKKENLSADKEDELKAYKSLIGYFLGEEIDFNDYYYGGLDFLKNNKKTEKYFYMQFVEEIKEELHKDLMNYRKDRILNYKSVKKKSCELQKRIYTIFCILIVIFGIYTVAVTGFILPEDKKIIAAEDCFIKKDYQAAAENLKNINYQKIPKTVKYHLAYSYIAIDNLSENQKKVLTESIGINSDENILDFWIVLGREDFEAALDIARKIGNSQIELYALLKYKYALETDLTIKGSEKQTKISALSSEIERIDQELHPEKYEKKYDNLDQQKLENKDSSNSENNKSDNENEIENKPENNFKSDLEQNNSAADNNEKNNKTDTGINMMPE